MLDDPSRGPGLLARIFQVAVALLAFGGAILALIQSGDPNIVGRILAAAMLGVMGYSILRN